MGFNCGIVGLPNVGKSTLFNALTASAAAAAENYPFCTIEPNVGRVAVPDHRLDALAKISQSAKIIPTFLEFVDIAGIVKGASKGEGLGNQFLSHIREVDAILHVLRCFEETDITHVEGTVDPLRDADIIEMELIFADIDSLERRLPALEKKAKGSKDPLLDVQIQLTNQALHHLHTNQPVRTMAIDPAHQLALNGLQLLTAKPVLYIANVAENEAATGNTWTEKVKTYAGLKKSAVVIISAAIEAKVAVLDPTEKAEYLELLGLQETGLSQVIGQGYKLLNLQTFFTIGPKEARAWTIYKGAKAPEAAGVIHSDFERGFIRAETISCADFIAYNGELHAKTAGKMRSEGRDYTVQDGDIYHFRFNV